MLQELNRFDHGKNYTAIIAYTDECCDKAHIAIENIRALSSRDALRTAKRRADRKGLKTGEIQIVRGETKVTGIWAPRNVPLKYVEDEVTWTNEATMDLRFDELIKG